MFREVTSALDQRLVAMTDVPPIAFPNVNFDPPEELYLVVMNMPADGIIYNFNRAQNTPGVYSVNIYAPANEGPAEAENMADKIAEHFREVSEPIPNLFIEEINFAAAVSTDSEYLLPVTINWRYFHTHG
jgi:hypothetical protein